MIKDMRILHIIFITIIAAVSFLVWWGLGHLVAWILDAGLNADVNKDIFVKVGIIIGLIKGSLIFIVGLIQNLILKKFE